jgi:hypothetical protein
VEIWQTNKIRTLYLTKASGVEYWYYSTSIAQASNYTVKAFDTTAGVTYTPITPVVVVSGQATDPAVNFRNLPVAGGAGGEYDKVFAEAEKQKKKLKEDFADLGFISLDLSVEIDTNQPLPDSSQP